MPDEDAERKYGYGEKMVSGPAQLAFVFGPDGCGSAEQAADKGWKQACKENHDLLEGLNIVDGKVVYKGVADAWGLPYTPVEEVL